MRFFALTVSTYFVCLVSGFIGIRIAPAMGLLDIPGGRRRHKEPVPRVGGLSLLVGMLLLGSLASVPAGLTWLEIGAISAMAVIGFLDDRLDLRARYKAVLGLFIASALAAGALSHLTLNPVAYRLLGVVVPPVPALLFVLLVLLFWCLPQAFNLIDGANGLATGFGLVVVGSLWMTGTPHPMVAGALLAVLALNWPRARLFLGDCGSLSIGLMLVIFAQKALLTADPNRLLWLFAYPIIDVCTVIAIRKITGRHLMVGDRNHLHFQFSDRWPAVSHFSVPILLGVATMCGSRIYVTGPWVAVPITGLILLLGIAAFFTVTSISATRAEGLAEDGEPARGDAAGPDGSHPEPANGEESRRMVQQLGFMRSSTIFFGAAAQKEVDPPIRSK